MTSQYHWCLDDFSSRVIFALQAQPNTVYPWKLALTMLPGKSIQTPLYYRPLVYIYFKGFKPHDSPSSWLVPSTDWNCGFTYRLPLRQQETAIYRWINWNRSTSISDLLSCLTIPRYCPSWPYLCGSKCFVAIAENYSGHIVLFGGGKARFIDYLGKYVLGLRRLNTLFVTCPYHSYLHLSPTYMVYSSPILWD
jgi:hypothetical protein